MATNAERQAAFRRRQAEAGLRSVTVMVPSRQVAAVMMLAAQLVKDRDLEVGLIRNVRTGRYQRP